MFAIPGTNPTRFSQQLRGSHLAPVLAPRVANDEALRALDVPAENATTVD
jgi:hypothetical protein